MEEIDLKELIDMFLRRKFLIIFVVLVFAALGAIYTIRFIVPRYESDTTLILVQTGAEISAEESDAITTADLTLNSKLVDNYKEICTSKSVLTKVINNLHLNYSYEKLKSNITVSTKSDTEVIKITVRDEDNQLACKIANEVAKVFVEKVEDLFKVKNILILDVAEVSNKPYNINLYKNIVIFAFVGAILVFAYILLINMLDTTIKTDTDIEKITGLPVLASIVISDENSKANSKKKKKRHSSTIERSNRITEEKQETEEQEDIKSQGSGTISMFSYLNDNVDDYVENEIDKKGWNK